METFESIVRIKHGSTVLVEIGDPMWQPVAIDGQQVVQSIARVRAAGGDTEPRGNDTHVLSYGKCVETASIEAALRAELTHAVTLPRTKDTVILQFEDETGFQLEKATVESWSGGQTERLARLGTVIRGGKMIAGLGGVLVSGITSPLAANGYYQPDGTLNDRPRYVRGIYEIHYGGVEWWIVETGEEFFPEFSAGDPSDLTPPLTGWGLGSGTGTVEIVMD